MGTKLSGGGTSIKIKSSVSGQRKPVASAGKKRDISMRMTRDAESPKARHKVARKGNAKPADNVATGRQARNRLTA